MILSIVAVLAVYGLLRRRRQGRARGENQTINLGPGNDIICEPTTKVDKGTHYYYEIVD